MIAGREEEIRNFQPQTWYGVTLTAEGVLFTWKDLEKRKQPDVFPGKSGRDPKESGGGTAGDHRDREKGKAAESAPQLYDLTELQRTPAGSSDIPPRRP